MLKGVIYPRANICAVQYYIIKHQLYLQTVYLKRTADQSTSKGRLQFDKNDQT